MDKKYILTEKEFNSMIPKSEMEEKLASLQETIDFITEATMNMAKSSRTGCIEGKGKKFKTSDCDDQRGNWCPFFHMCNWPNKIIREAPRKLDHMIE